ncbi:hypothetical protein JIN84_17805 [Luteolibacter yonseiensis]|uniref:Capsid protein n=1 Tax=Luteolibacter yonseiensis TaxID=1144680 RepID=A0A934R942_9BACT|nr:DUF4043 family protein [Luteolibacter yonseiensis]MBK1817480.1 hypothetical protein [Luteolibacter yonseiensis]
MPGTYNANATVQALADAVAMDPNVRQKAISQYLETTSLQHNALERFTSEIPANAKVGKGVGSVFAKKTDLTKGGASQVDFHVVGTPGGPGVQGDTELTGRTSNARLGTYQVTVDWVRDGFEMSRDMIEFLAAGKSLVATVLNLMSEKMGILKQNHMFARLIKSATPWNTYRPNNRMSTDALIATDTLSLDVVNNAKPRLRRMGAKPLERKLQSSTSSPVDGFMLFASDTAMLPIRNDSSFQTAIANGDERGTNNANFTGELLKWQGQSFYELPVTDQDWDDFKGGPLIARAVISVGFQGSDAAPELIANASNTLSRYFQWFDGYQFSFNRQETTAGFPAVDSSDKYAWVINPDGSLGFVSYVGSGNNGNKITIKNVLSPKAGAGKRATTVGQLTTSGTTNVWTGGASTLPVTGTNGAWNYTDIFVADAVVIQANAQGVPYARSFVFGAMAACFADGRIRMSPIEQIRDYGFTIGKGFEMIFGTCVTRNTIKNPTGYLMVEHAVEHEGYPVPSKI